MIQDALAVPEVHSRHAGANCKRSLLTGVSERHSRRDSEHLQRAPDRLTARAVRKAAAHMRMIGDPQATAIAQQFPEEFSTGWASNE